jgi:hypothetical protein
MSDYPDSGAGFARLGMDADNKKPKSVPPEHLKMMSENQGTRV